MFLFRIHEYVYLWAIWPPRQNRAKGMINIKFYLNMKMASKMFLITATFSKIETL